MTDRSSTKLVFCSFGDSRLHRSAKRLADQARQMGCYDTVFIWDEHRLDEAFRARHRELLRRSSRGYGFWVWKPYVVQRVLASLDEGDIVHYADIGCWLNPRGRERLLQYAAATRNAPAGILTFQIANTSDDVRLRHFTYPEYVWTKGDLFDYFGERWNTAITHTEQIVATTFFIRKQPNTTRLVEDWLRVYESGYYLVNDEPSRAENFKGFTEHRHDQSVFSLLAKRCGALTRPYFEIYWPTPRVEHPREISDYAPDWRRLEKYPIWAKRDKDRGPLRELLRRTGRFVKRIVAKAGTPEDRVKLTSES